MTNLVKIKEKVNKELSNQETLHSLMQTTFKGIEDPQLVKRAMMEAMMRGYSFQDFLEKNIYAIPFNVKTSDGKWEKSYSLVTSIDHARKIGMRSGVVGKSAPEFKEKDNGSIESCTVTIKRKVGSYVGDYTATVFFDEYKSDKNHLWKSKPHTMLAKVAEMHALRMACPEEMSQVYVEEEMQQEAETPRVIVTVDVSEYEKKLRDAKTQEELKKTWVALPATARKELEGVKDEVKKSIQSEKKDTNDNKEI